jgi:ElaB/YqjD/DUF883 family membrane-anchored ribosome-binding protein
MAQGSTQYRRPENASNAGSDLKDKATDQFGKMADKATDQFQRAADSVEDAAGRIAQQGRAAGEQMQEVAGNIKGAVDKSVKDQPMATLAVVAALGFVLGALWKS